MSDTSVIPDVADPDLDVDEPTESHIVRKKDTFAGYIEGQAIRALCGKLWVPSKNPHDLPVCPVCTERFKALGGPASSN